MSNKTTLNMNLDSVDAMIITDSNGKIMYSIRYNPRFCNEKGNIYKDIINKNVLEVYPSLTQDESSIFQCIKNATPVYNEGQKFYDIYGNPYFTENLAIPIIRSGKLMGAIELSKDITSIKDIEINKSMNHKGKNKFLKKTTTKYSFDDIITVNHKMNENIEKAKIIANSPSSVLVYGETGTGKELFVQSIHNYSNRCNKPFVAQNCAAIPETLFESILFGTTEGAYTGAINRAGLFEQADGGTLFLDEINSMPIHLQAKLLRVLQDCSIRRVGDTKDKKVDVRIIAAMNEEPLKALASKHIREDLFYRLGVVTFKLIPLRERKEDIPLLVRYFIKYYNDLFNKNIKGITDSVKDLFLKYDWAGNVRELQHVIESSMNLVSIGNIEISHLPIYFCDLSSKHQVKTNSEEVINLSAMMNSFEKDAIKKALSISESNISKAAGILKIPRQTLQYKIKKYKLELDDEN